MNIIREKNNLEINAKYLEELITDLMSGENQQSVFKSMKKTLNRMMDDECEEIFISKSDEMTNLYGMSVYLSERSLHELSRILVDPREKSKDVTKFIIDNKKSYMIDIDDRILKPMYGFKPDEITAILLHELGHTLGDSDFYNDIREAYMKAIFENEKELPKDVLNDTKIQFGMIYILNVIQNTHMSKFTPIEKEQLADKFVVDCGYGKSLVNVFDKFVELNNEKLNKKSVADKSVSDAKLIVGLNNTFKVRRKYVTDLIDAERKQTSSNCLKDLLGKIKNRLSSIILHECIEGIDVYNNYILDESFMDLFKRNPIKMSQVDIDNLKIEMEMMENYDDKSCLVYKIHKRIAQLNNAKTKLNPTDKDFKTNLSYITNYTNQLNSMLKEVMKFKVQEKTYGLFIKYPKGYEG